MDSAVADESVMASSYADVLLCVSSFPTAVPAEKSAATEPVELVRFVANTEVLKRLTSTMAVSTVKMVFFLYIGIVLLFVEFYFVVAFPFFYTYTQVK